MLEDNLDKRVSFIVGFQVVHHDTKSNKFWMFANNTTYHFKKTSKFQNTLELMQMASELKKIWEPRKVANNEEISNGQKYICAKLAKQGNKLDLKEKNT